MSNEKTFDIAAFGEAMVEFNQAEGASSRRYLQGFGGDTSNFAIAASRNGSRVAYVSALGNDPYGRMLRNLWDNEGVDHTDVLTDPDAFSAVYFVTHSENGHEFSFFRNGSAASRLKPSTLPRSRIQQSRLLHLSGISLAISHSACDAAYSAIELAHASGALVSFDTNLRLKLWSIDRARAVMTDVMKHCDICLPSFDDVVAITDLTDPDQLVDYCLNLGAKTVALKLGDRGCIVANSNERHHLEAIPSQFKDATGAGDTFGGAFVARLLAGDNLLAAGSYANVAASLSTQGFGAVEPIPTSQQVALALKNLIVKN
jgi:2-dehydro-3-deoxygluconokinase